MNKLQSLFNVKTRMHDAPRFPTLRTGHFFYGHIIKLLPNDFAQINIKGVTMTAKLQTPLVAGKQYLLQVEQTDPYPRLKVFSTHAQTNQFGVTEESSLLALLKELRLPTTAKYRKLMAFFRDEGIPFSQSLIQKADACLRNNHVEQSLETLKMMLTNKLPIERKIFEALHSLRSEESFMTQFKTLNEMLQTLPHQSERVLRLQEQLLTIKRSITTTMQGVTIQTETTGAERSLALPSPIQHVLTSLGFNYDKHAVQFLTGKLPLEKFEVHTRTLKPTLLALLNEEIPNKVRELTQEVLNRMTGHQLLLQQEESLQHILLRLPLPVGMSESNLTVQFQGKQKEGPIDPDYCRVLFYLHLKKLQETVIDVHIQNRLLAVTIYNEFTYARIQLKPLERILKDRLQAIGYQLSSVQWKQVSNRTMNEKELFSFEGFHHHKGVDYRV